MADSQGKTVMVQGRLVFPIGDLFKGKHKEDQNTRQLMYDNQNQPVIEYGFGLAVPKSVLNQTGPGQPGEIWAAIHEEARSLYPSGQVPPSFAWKYKDGDGVDHNGAPFSQREGYAGHLVFACTTRIPIKFFKWENGQNILVNEGIKIGDYVNVQLMIKAHTAVGQGKPGLYLNPMAVQFLGFGKEIVNTPSGDQIFGTQAPPVPPGASPTPIAPAGFIVPQASPISSAPVYPAQPQAAPVPAAPAPHYGVLPPVHQPAPQVAAYVPPAAPAPQYAAPVPNGMPQMPPPPGYPVQQ